jgi:ATP-dependent DNA helicase RecG
MNAKGSDEALIRADRNLVSKGLAMTDTLLLQERVRNTIQLGESHFREFKSAWEGPVATKRGRLPKKIAADIAEALVAFANADGGELLIGVEDDGSITGVPHSEEEIAGMLSAPNTHVHPDASLPMLAATRLTIDGKTVLFFGVAKGTSEIYQLPDGRCVRRKDKATIPATPRQIQFDRAEVRSREYDRQFVDGASVNDLDVNLVQAVANEFLAGLSVERYLQQIGVAEYGMNGLRLRVAAVLLFARDIQKWHPRCQVRILKVAGTELKTGEHYNVTSDEHVTGNIFELLNKSWEALRPFLAYKTEFGPDARFEQKYTYPEWACREALVNAIAHRDYTVHSGIDVFIFDDRMEIRNPGALLSNLTLADLEDLKGAHESRNALIAKVLRENKFMRELGEGMRRMFELMAENELEKPKLASDTSSFAITLSHRSVFTAQQEQWLLMFQQFGLSTLQKRIMVLGMGDREISPAEIYKAMNTDDRNTYDREVTALRTSGLLVEIRTNPQATRLARSNKIPKNQVPRFRVQVPGVPTPPREPVMKPVVGNRRSEEAYGIYVGNLPYATREEDLSVLFSRCGNVRRINIPTEAETGQQRGFAFVWFDVPGSVAKAIKELDGHWFLGTRLTVRQYRSSSRPARPRPANRR